MEGKGEGLSAKTLKDDRAFPKKPAKLKQPGAFKKRSKDKLLMADRSLYVQSLSAPSS